MNRIIVIVAIAIFTSSCRYEHGTQKGRAVITKTRDYPSDFSGESRTFGKDIFLEIEGVEGELVVRLLINCSSLVFDEVKPYISVQSKGSSGKLSEVILKSATGTKKIHLAVIDGGVPAVLREGRSDVKILNSLEMSCDFDGSKIYWSD